MKLIILFTITLWLTLQAQAVPLKTDTLSFGAFSRVYLFRHSEQPKSVVLFIAGERGWTSSMNNICTQISEQGAMVAGFGQKNFYSRAIVEKDGCYYPAGDLEELSEFIQKKYHVKEYKKPILIGYGSGATLAYGAFAQAPANTFRGVISLNFNPKIKINKPFCDGDGLASRKLKTKDTWYFEPSKKLTASLILLQGNEKAFNNEAAQKFVSASNNAELVPIPYSPKELQTQWMPYLLKAFQKVRQPDLVPALPPTDGQLPKDLPIKAIPSYKDTLPMLVFISGDGGWTSFDQSVCQEFSKNGIPVIGIDAQKYFWEKKTQEQTTADISKAISYYLQQYGRKSFILLGYSFGASLTPFISNHFAEPFRKLQTSLIAISPDAKADFEIHVADMLNFGSSENELDVIAEMKKVKGLRKICIFGSEESETLRKKFSVLGSDVFTLPGNHHFDNDYQGLVNFIIKTLKYK